MSPLIEQLSAEFSGLMIFAMAYLFFVASPGPAVAAIVARSLATGARRTMPFLMGIALGDVLWFTCAVLGLATFANQYPLLIKVLQYAGALYLAYLAYKIWLAPVAVNDVMQIDAQNNKAEGISLFIGGFIFCLGNPKPIVFFMALLPALLAIESISFLRYAVVSGLIVVILLGSLGAYAIMADRARLLLTSERSLRIVNQATALMMLGAAIAVSVRPI
jgi:threonine/homoserine/homoserine lactone efflux protein